MNVDKPENRLQRGWGLIDSQHCHKILSHISGGTLLDIGCGYGSLTDYARRSGLKAIGIDIDRASLEYAKSRYPYSSYQLMGAERIEDLHEKFDTVVLRDSLHHLLHESNIDSALSAMMKVLSPDGRVIVFDPNLNFILRCARFIARHRDFSCSALEAISLFKKAGFTCRSISYYEVCGLALTGGYVGPEIIGSNEIVIKFIALINNALSCLFNDIGIGSYTCWRYTVVFERKRE